MRIYLNKFQITFETKQQQKEKDRNNIEFFFLSVCFLCSGSEDNSRLSKYKKNVNSLSKFNVKNNIQIK